MVIVSVVFVVLLLETLVFVELVVVTLWIVVVSVGIVVVSRGIVVGVVGVVGGSSVVVVVVCVPSNLPSMYACALTPKSKFLRLVRSKRASRSGSQSGSQPWSGIR